MLLYAQKFHRERMKTNKIQQDLEVAGLSIDVTFISYALNYQFINQSSLSEDAAHIISWYKMHNLDIISEIALIG